MHRASLCNTVPDAIVGTCRTLMGLFVSKQSTANRQINRDLLVTRKENRRCIRLLLLGAGESGKSTIVKQLRILHLNGFDRDELAEYRPLVYSNVLSSAAALIEASEVLRIPFNNSNLLKGKHLVLEIVGTENEWLALTPAVHNYIEALWADEGIRRCYERRHEFQLNDSAQYFLDKLHEITADDYVPTVQDVIQSRAATLGIVEIIFPHKNLIFRIIDVGGQRSERRKWIHQFEQVEAIIFIVAISEYDQVMREDHSMNRMVDALSLFENTINNQWFHATQVILFLNKRDLFAEKLKLNQSISTAFPHYKGTQDYDECIKYVATQLLSLNKETSRQINVHQTCATDGNQVHAVINDVIDAIIDANMKNAHGT